MSLKPEDGDQPKWSSRDPWSPLSRPPGAYPPSPNPDAHLNGDPRSITEAVRARKDEYMRKKTIRIKVGTWNVAAAGSTYKDLGGWFADGLGVKGLKQDLSGTPHDADSDDDGGYASEEAETVEAQEARVSKKSSTIPRNDTSALASGSDVDLYVLGLQEVTDVSSVTEAMRPFTDPNPAKKWKRALRKHLPMGYKKVVEQQLIGLLLLVFASSDLAPQVSSVDSTSVGTGLMGYLGNKGAVSARILLGETTRMLFVNCHLAAGADNAALNRRIWDAQQILSRTKFHPVGPEWIGGIGQSEVIGDEDVAFWFGDLNYRLDDIPGEDVRRLLLLHTRNEYDILNKSKRRIDSELGYVAEDPTDEMPSHRDEIPDAELPAARSNIKPELDPQNDPASLVTTLKSLLTHDQLLGQQRAKKVFHEGWREGEINFLPTYKYDIGSVAMFDSGEKKRSPSWCDRILYRTRRDYDRYKMQTAQDEQGRKKDADMKQRGLDDAASQEDVLFDYDPEADGDDYDDEVEQRDNNGDATLVGTADSYDEELVIEEYVTHQRVLSSDHKPLSAVFSLTYDAVDTDLKAKVHQHVTREFDKAENEARPSVTLVLDHSSFSTSITDRSSDAPELKVVDFGDIRYRVLYEHRITIANTGQIEVLFAFIDRPAADRGAANAGQFPPWLKVEVHQEPESKSPALADLGSGERYKLQPGETTSIELLVEISEDDLARHLNAGEIEIDDILVLRISNGRDYFIPIKGRWLQTCFYRTIDELVRIPSGVRNLTISNANAQGQRQPSNNIVHSAPQELFTLTDTIPKMAERAMADWDMLHEEDPAWKTIQAWPFNTELSSSVNEEMRTERLAEIREALDTSSPLDEHLSPIIDSAEKLSLLAETLIDFLTSLSDGIVRSDVWQVIESSISASEKTKQVMEHDRLQEIVMEAISATPIHSVCFTFITFMLNQLISEIHADMIQERKTHSTGRSRSSTSASAMSDVSLSSVRSSRSGKPRFSFLPSLTRRSTNSSGLSMPTTPTEVKSPAENDDAFQLAHTYAELFAPVVIRSDTTKLKSKEKKIQLARKVKALQAFLISQP